MASDTRLDVAIRQIEFARQYTLGLLADVDDRHWFTMPHGGPTHIAWQVGHLAMAEYGLTMFRQRDRQREDSQLMSSRFRKKFSRDSIPHPDPAENPSPDEIRDVLERVHQQALRELAEYPVEQLDEPLDEPYAAFATKLGALIFCSHHEMLHAGQIGLLKRGLDA